MATRPLSGDNSPVTTPVTSQATIQTVFAILGRDGAGDLIDALLDAMNAADGDPDLSSDGDELDGDGEGDDQSWPESHGKGYIGGLRGLAMLEDAEEDDEDRCTAGDDQGGQFRHVGYASGRDDEDRELDDEDHSFGDTTGADPKHRDRIRRTRCRVTRDRRHFLTRGYSGSPLDPIGWELKHEPTVPTRIRRLKRKTRVATNVVPFRRGAR